MEAVVGPRHGRTKRRGEGALVCGAGAPIVKGKSGVATLGWYNQSFQDCRKTTSAFQRSACNVQAAGRARLVWGSPDAGHEDAQQFIGFVRRRHRAPGRQERSLAAPGFGYVAPILSRQSGRMIQPPSGLMGIVGRSTQGSSPALCWSIDDPMQRAGSGLRCRCFNGQGKERGRNPGLV